MAIDRSFVREDQLFVRAVRDAHDVDVVKIRAAFAPISVGHDVKSADLLTCFDFPAGRDRPVKQRIEFRDTLAGL